MMMMIAALVLLGLSSVYGQSSITCVGLGVFDNRSPYDRLPIPHCPEDLGDELVLDYYSTNNNQIGEQVVGIDRTTIPREWSPDRPTVFVVHGWTNNVDTDWLQGFKDAHLDLYDMNVCIVGWGGQFGAGDVNYQSAASTTRTIGAHLGEVIENLIVAGGALPSSFHLVGHSLGAHLSGHAGRWAATEYSRTLNRITGMDPAGPEFKNVTDRTIGLHTDCASFVDTINTDGSLGSTPLGVGHQNYFPNGGVVQPGCESGPENTCSHIRAIPLYQESLDPSTCLFASYDSCTDAANLPGSCSPCAEICGAMGYPANQYTDGTYYLTTNPTAPFC